MSHVLLNAVFSQMSAADFRAVRLESPLCIHIIVSTEQLGFVPNRNIAEATHLTKLIQNYLNDKDEDGLILAHPKARARANVHPHPHSYRIPNLPSTFQVGRT
eukprot:scaffold25886_cov135-Isochrysis_galbana.AAC.3